MGKVKSAKTNYAAPGKAMNQHEFELMIKEAENSTFHSIKTVKEELGKWKSRYSK